MNSGHGLPYHTDMSGAPYGAYQPRPVPYQQQYGAPQYLPQPSPRPPQPPSYSLLIEQNPERAKLVAKDKIKDRKPIDPPPIIRCQHSDSASAYNPYLFCSVTLWDEEKDEPKQSNTATALLVGSTVSSAHRLKALNNDEGTFFVFGDLAPSCSGTARLHFVLYELKDGHTQALASTTSGPFEVSSAKDWDGVKESTVLSRTFADQGVKLRLKKESRNGRGRMPQGQYQMPPTSQPQILPQLQPQMQPSVPYPGHPHAVYQPQHQSHSTGSWDDDDDTDSRGGKRQRTSYAGSAAYPGYASSSQASMSSYRGYSAQEAANYGYPFQYQSRTPVGGQQSPAPPYSQSPAQHYSPQQFEQYQRPQYYPPQHGQQASSQQYGGYAMPSAQYPTQTYAPVDNPQQSFDAQSQASYGQSQQPQQPPLTLPPMRQAPPGNPEYNPQGPA